MKRNLRKLWLIVPNQLPAVLRRCNETAYMEIQLKNSFGLKLRADALLAGELSVSRSRIKKWFDNGLVTSGQEVLLPGAKIVDEMVIQIKKEEAIRQELLDV